MRSHCLRVYLALDFSHNCISHEILNQRPPMQTLHHILLLSCDLHTGSGIGAYSWFHQSYLSPMLLLLLRHRGCLYDITGALFCSPGTFCGRFPVSLPFLICVLFLTAFLHVLVIKGAPPGINPSSRQQKKPCKHDQATSQMRYVFAHAMDGTDLPCYILWPIRDRGLFLLVSWCMERWLGSTWQMWLHGPCWNWTIFRCLQFGPKTTLERPAWAGRWRSGHDGHLIIHMDGKVDNKVEEEMRWEACESFHPFCEDFHRLFFGFCVCWVGVSVWLWFCSAFLAGGKTPASNSRFTLFCFCISRELTDHAPCSLGNAGKKLGPLSSRKGEDF